MQDRREDDGEGVGGLDGWMAYDMEGLLSDAPEPEPERGSRVR